MFTERARLQKELQEIVKDKSCGVSCQPIGEDITKLMGIIQGPKDSPYEEGTFLVDIQVDKEYPFSPPKMRFITRVWHPNISSASGAICLDILKDKWSPAFTLKTCMLSLQALLCEPQPNDPQDAVVAQEYLQDVEKWKQTAKSWTQQFATRSTIPDKEKMQRITEMGFTKEQAEAALQYAQGDEVKALEMLLGS